MARLVSRAVRIDFVRPLGFGAMSLPIMFALIPVIWTLELEPGVHKSFLPAFKVTRRHFPRIVVPFRLKPEEKYKPIAFSASLFGWIIRVEVPRESIVEVRSGVVFFQNQGRRMSLDWVASSTLLLGHRAVASGQDGSKIQVESEALARLGNLLRRRAKEKTHLATIARLRDALMANRKDLNKPLWIIGNASSVEPPDLDLIPSDQAVFAMNRFHLSYPLHKLREDAVFSADDLVIANFGAEIVKESLGTPIFGSGKLRAKITGAITFPLSKSHLDRFRIDLANEVNPFGSTLIVAIQVGLALGFKTICLYGVEFDFSGESKTTLLSNLQRGGDNHFIENYRAGLPWNEPHWDRIFVGLLSAAVASHAIDAEILNYSKLGKLALFEKRIIGQGF